MPAHRLYVRGGLGRETRAKVPKMDSRAKFAVCACDGCGKEGYADFRFGVVYRTVETPGSVDFRFREIFGKFELE